MPNILGGKPQPNSSTLTPKALAEKKCPASCTMMSTVSKSKNRTTVTNRPRASSIYRSTMSRAVSRAHVSVARISSSEGLAVDL